MKKGEWLYRLIQRVVEGSIEVGEAISFLIARISSIPKSFCLEGMHFEKADHTLWSIAAEIIVCREYSPPNFEIGPDDIVVDIGAHLGTFVAFAAKRTNSQIIAYEPHPENYQKLKALIQKYNWTNVVSFNHAVGATNGTANFFISDHSSRHNFSGKDPVTGKRLHNSIQVKIEPLKDVLANFKKIDLLKIDCEGSEFDILLSSDASTLKKTNRMVIEYHGFENSEQLLKLVRKLKGLDFVVTSKPKKGEPLGILYAQQEMENYPKTRS